MRAFARAAKEFVPMPTKRCRSLGAALALVTSLIAAAAQAQILPTIYVTASRLDRGIAGTSTTIITAEEIERSPAHSLQDILALQPGLQVQNLYGSVAGARDVLDMRGFGAAATSNALVLVNGRRLNEVDMAGVDFSAIPRESIERIEIIRGNSGAVLYGDGAVGGVINIVTKSGVGLPPALRAGGATGSYRYGEGNISANASAGPLVALLYTSGIYSDGYRVNNALRQHTGVGEIRHIGGEGSAYINLSADAQHLGLPGGRRVTLTSNELVTDRRGAATPFDWADKQGVNLTLGVTRKAADGLKLILDGGVRQKRQQAAFFSAFGSLFDNYLDTTLTTYSLTPRLHGSYTLLGMPAKLIAGLDVYHSVYHSDRMLHAGDAPYHRYDLRQTTAAGYFQHTLGLRPNTEASVGLRLQRNAITARDRYDPSAPGAAFVTVEGLPLDKSEMQYAAHVGLEHRLANGLALFGRIARSFRVPNVDERVGQSPFGVPTTFDLKTQTSRDVEGGVRLRWGPFDLQSSAYLMDLNNELHYSTATFTNVNLPPTRRYGVENLATWRLSETVRLTGGLAYTRAVFREGTFAGNDVPLVSRWTANAGVSWDIWHKHLVLDAVVKYIGARRMDNDQANFQPLIPAHAVVDVRIGGENARAFWSFAVQNLFNASYFNYAIASATTFGTYNAYPLPGRTYMARLGVKLP